MRLTAAQRACIRYMRDKLLSGWNVDIHVMSPNFAPDFARPFDEWAPEDSRRHRRRHKRRARGAS